ncbi:MAG TPA: DMT family transporter [Propionibacteriaceae bacterium]|nr:DMT family transporter [Propionibacteriaceae bacterium]
MTRRGWLLFIALSLCWGIPYLFIRVAVVDLDPLIVAFGRTALGGLILLPLALRARALRPLLTHWKILLLYTVVEIIGPWFLLGHAETRLNSSTTGLIIAVVPIVAAIILTVMGLDRLDARRISGLVIGLAGVALLVGLDVRLDDFIAVGQLLLVVIGYAIGPIIISRRLADLPSLGVVTASLLIAAAAYAPFTPLVWPQTWTAPALGSVIVLAVVCTAIAFLVMFALIAEAGPARMTLITYASPAVAVILGAIVLGEPLTVGLAIGFPLVIVGSVLGTWRSSPRTDNVVGTDAVPTIERER